ncbi:Txe/YoeB family addiction module toxin [Planktothrix agardhii]|uniref:Txe/YoeB family addiction module toxin n=1 Tax=Planktothrix agardhii TaxID=1160 RepID=UPI001D0AE578|nr:Txe/YoeB family addiction module toxin [Planktothrix agardhii]MCB8782925.1 Txe/YoeB family addiction module toxin [Planktothrix agardhii 1808]MCB8750631.1 Txe/YoeB family addiction module toxin [Planktothrix agardhii 1810]MCB8764868.1 Txe/YoeB family addiction module toxin [Planktothrix agardhii 1809]MCB8778508.1 Txe/YoeB family addiction module toxin [Planktothrix agardhii 1031]MCF3566049.1 Txe/YoeB family addiction module toxin [Planktothrix agardhii 1807]
MAFIPRSFDEFNQYQWAIEDKKIYTKIVTLIKDIQRDPFSGLGKPEALKHDLSGLWSRRITQEHRLVYNVTDEEIVIVSCKFHY